MAKRRAGNGPSLNEQETQEEPQWARVSELPLIKAACIGDVGRVIGVISHDGSGLLRLVLSVRPDHMLLLGGGLQSIQEILDNMAFQTVEVVEAEGSAYGFHGVRPV